MKSFQNALIFSTVWPEPDSSAAGIRQMQWIHLLLELFEQVTLVSSAKTKGIGDWGAQTLPDRVRLLPLPLNRWEVASDLKALNPELVLFDRFILEEQFGAIVYEALPDALCLLETQDLHFVRRAREGVRETWVSTPDPAPSFYETDTALREIAALERVDFSFLVSSFEEKLLKEGFGIGPEQQVWMPFLFEPVLHPSAHLPFSDRRDFVWIGNFRHAPNADGLRWFKREIWPEIRERLPGVGVRIYGAYPSAEFMAWNRDSSAAGLEVKGSARSLDEVFSGARVNLAPLRFGAGVKGKILDGFRFGVPVVTTKVGFEGLLAQGSENPEFGGIVGNSASEFVEGAVKLFQGEACWTQCHRNALRDLEKTFDRAASGGHWILFVKRLLEKKKANQFPSFRSRLLRQELMNSRKYFSKWIEEKEKNFIPGSEGHPGIRSS